MSTPPQIPPQANFLEDYFRDEYEWKLLKGQRLQMPASGTRDAVQPPASATCAGINPSYATNAYIPHIQSQISLCVRPSEGNRWNSHRMSNELITLATSRNALHATPTPNHSHYMYVSREESVIPEDAVFPIDISVVSRPTNAFTSKMCRQRRHDQAPQRPRCVYVDHVVASTVSYDDSEIPRQDPLWLVRPHQHPWIRGGLAYLCPYNACDTIVQEKNRHVHNERAHGMYGY